VSEFVFQLGGARVPFELLQWEPTKGGRSDLLALRSPYHPGLVAEIKGLEGRKWRPRERVWTFPPTPRNDFALRIWTGDAFVKSRYDTPLRAVGPRPVPGFEEGRPCKPYQLELMVPFFLQRRRGVLAAEQGLGKTLAAIEAMERLEELEEWADWWYVCQANAFDGVWSEWKKWRAGITPRWFTYDALWIFLKKHPDFAPPRGVVFDESAHLKNPEALRTKAALELQARMAAAHGDLACVWLMSGVPAPQDSSDWWAQAEVAQPGFLRESSKRDLLRRLAILTVDVEQKAAEKFEPIKKAWDEKQIPYEQFEAAALEYAEATKECRNASTGQVIFDVLDWKWDEIELLHQRLEGLVLRMSKAKYRKDLPEKRRRIVQCEYTLEDLELAETVASQAKSGAKAAIDLRTLSDGFRYHVNPRTGVRETIYAGSPKEGRLRELLAEVELGWHRAIVFAGFQASVDLCTKICREEGWAVIQVDGRHRTAFDLKARPSQDTFLDLERYPQKIAWVANAGAGGMGQTLSTSPVEIFYSNGFKGGDRAQAEDRFHREGAQEARPELDYGGPTIIDLFWLPTDPYVLGRLDDKKALSDLTTSDMVDVIRAARERLLGRAAEGKTTTTKKADLLAQLGAVKEDLPCQTPTQDPKRPSP
jgi:hypothetical protein